MKKEITVTIEKIGAGGDGIATYEGQPVYVPKTAPGDIARVAVHDQNRDRLFAKLTQLETRGAERVASACPHDAVCGGCALQHISAASYQAWTIEKVKTALTRAGVESQAWGEPVFIPPGTRRRTTLRALKHAGGIVMGYNEPGSSQIIDIERCLVVEPALEAKMLALRPYLARLLPERATIDLFLQHIDGQYDLVIAGLGNAIGIEITHVMTEMANALDIARISVRDKSFDTPDILLNRKPVIKKMGVMDVILPPGAFLQASVEGEDVLSKLVIQHIGKATHIADLFAGCGTFSGRLVAKARVHAVEQDAEVVNALKATKTRGLSAERRDLFKNPMGFQELSPFDAIVFDPPRAGAQEQATQIARSSVPIVVGVSCNPVSFARDARLLQDGGYNMQSITIVDQFTWSSHVELVALFKKQTRPKR